MSLDSTRVIRRLAALGLALVLPAFVLSSAVAGDGVGTAKVPAAETHEVALKVWKKGQCGLCHSVAAAEIEATVKSEKMRGPDLGGFTTEDPKALLAYLRQEAEVDGTRHKREFKGSDEELTALLDWLATQASADG